MSSTRTATAAPYLWTYTLDRFRHPQLELATAEEILDRIRHEVPERATVAEVQEWLDLWGTGDWVYTGQMDENAYLASAIRECGLDFSEVAGLVIGVQREPTGDLFVVERIVRAIFIFDSTEELAGYFVKQSFTDP